MSDRAQLIFQMYYRSSVTDNPQTLDANVMAGIHNVSTMDRYILRSCNAKEEEADESEEAEVLAEEADEVVNPMNTMDINGADDRANKYPKIVFLGTSSTRPTGTRNNTSILVHTS